nr:hypothetical protein [Rhodococcus ruber]
MAVEVAQAERRPEQIRDALRQRCRDERLEPPAATRVARMVAAALHRAEDALLARTVGLLDEPTTVRLLGLVTSDDAEDLDDDGRDGVGPGRAARREVGPSLLRLIRSEPGAVSLESMLTEIDKLEAIAGSGCPRTCSTTSLRRSWRAGVPRRWWSPRRTCALTLGRRR